ncbi:Coenzyme Q-binding protein coq10a, mitochondrial [Podila epicladia]|nr:Coenzyme Q-binding protein coq10a, mitochondrial [Podila epicladia]
MSSWKYITLHGQTLDSLRMAPCSVYTSRVNYQRRMFIGMPSLPKLPNILNPLANFKTTKRYKDRKLLKYSQQEFYDLVANVDDYQNFLPWCTYSKMSEPLPSPSASGSKPSSKDGSEGEIAVRHGELGIGFNSFQERYVSKVTCQAPWTVTAVSYDSKLFKELSTTWKFTPNIPKSTTLEAGLDQEVQERKLLTKSPSSQEQVGEEDKEEMPSTTTTMTAESADESSQSDPLPSPKAPSPTPLHYFTAAAVFGASALPYPTSNYETASPNPPSPKSTSVFNSTRSSTPTSQSKPMPSPLPSRTPKLTANESPVVVRTASPSNLGTMRPSDYPSVWVDFEIDFEFASPVHASMSSMFFDQVSKEMLAAFIQRAQVLYGKR